MGTETEWQGVRNPAKVDRNINLAEPTTTLNYWSPLTHLVEECDPKASQNDNKDYFIAKGKGGIKFRLPAQRTKAPKGSHNEQRRKLIKLQHDEATVHAKQPEHCKQSKEGQQLKEEATGVFDTGATSGVAMEEDKQHL